MKQIVDKLNKIAKAIDENVELSDRDLIIDSLDSITKAFGGTPNNSNLIVDKLEDIASVVHGGGGSEAKKVVIISEQTVQGEYNERWGTYDIQVELENELTSYPDTLNVVLDGVEYTANNTDDGETGAVYLVGESDENYLAYLLFSEESDSQCELSFPDGNSHTIEVYTELKEAVEVRTCTITIDNKSDQDVYVGDMFSESMPEPIILNDGIVDIRVASEVVPIGSQKEIKLIYSTLGTNNVNALICYLASDIGVNSFKNQINCEKSENLLIATDKTHDSSATLVYNVK